QTSHRLQRPLPALQRRHVRLERLHLVLADLLHLVLQLLAEVADVLFGAVGSCDEDGAGGLDVAQVAADRCDVGAEAGDVAPEVGDFGGERGGFRWRHGCSCGWRGSSNGSVTCGYPGVVPGVPRVTEQAA